MKIRHLEFAVKSYETEKVEKTNKLRKVSEKVSQIKHEGKKQAESFRAIRESLLKGKGESGDREFLMKILAAKKRKLSAVSEEKGTLQEELLKIQRQLAKVAKKKEKAGELLAAKKEVLEGEKREIHSEQDTALYYLSSEREASLRDIQREAGDPFSGLSERKDLLQRELLAPRRAEVSLDQLQVQAEVVHDSSSLAHGEQAQGEHSSQSHAGVYHGGDESSEQPTARQSFDQLCERLAQMESWQNGDTSHFHCSYLLSSGSEIGLQVHRQHNGKLQVLLVSHEASSSIELKRGMRHLEKQLSEAGFTEVALELRDTSQRRAA